MLGGTLCRFDVRNAQSVSLSAHEGLFLYQWSFSDGSYESNGSSGSNLCICGLVAQTQVICTCVRRVVRNGVVHSNGHISASIGRMDLVLVPFDPSRQGLSIAAFKRPNRLFAEEIRHFEAAQ